MAPTAAMLMVLSHNHHHFIKDEETTTPTSSSGEGNVASWFWRILAIRPSKRGSIGGKTPPPVCSNPSSTMEHRFGEAVELCCWSS
ncbi:hypothetical protein Scep_018445 [Stephania cephalantha]|uniref:Uncharacterized protein n=1 Tax=Stephania cephalantha TaxID=152367 RepID=A0AAP0I9V2_9MAGN